MPSRTGTCNQRSITASTNYEGAMVFLQLQVQRDIANWQI